MAPTTRGSVSSSKSSSKSSSMSLSSYLLSPRILPSVLLLSIYLYGLHHVLTSMHTALPSEPHPFSSTLLLWPVAGTLGYLAILAMGNKYMASRPEMDIKHHMFTYNVYQVVLNVWTVVEMIREINRQGYTSMNNIAAWGTAVDRTANGWRLGMLIYVHYVNKYVEMFDTYFMVMRKKTEQQSFLHIYHHTLLVWAWFTAVTLGCGGETYFGACINSFIHVVMYSYYLCAQLGITVPWKRYITQAQMLQFCVCFAHAANTAIYHKHLDWRLPAMQMFVMVCMLVLFGQFYMKSYKKGGKAKAK
uniref:Very-long-chain 3-oxoacyl-CoA synthase n=1 Tax=Pycnococcus provasolii TaxID=41880 RepID=A0A7S2ANA5_9CHLO|mmetsp:Transcript_12938/g.29431  ORF Transcript_12938/g.29431 Transcript_12938/m.29431 type:complete len:303 (+) Transcript_12938:42-950(+)